MIQTTNFIIASLIPSNNANTGWPRLPMVLSANAKIMANTMSGSSCISVAAAIRFGDTIDSTISVKPVSCFARIFAGNSLFTRLIPLPGEIQLTITRPIKTANLAAD